MVELFKKYGAQYNVDYLLMAAQGYQESTLDQKVKSPVGAIGVMQVMPPTGKELNVGDITEIDAEHPRRREVHAVHGRPVLQGRADGQPEQGADDVRVLQRRARRVRQLRREAAKRGLDPNVWFGNVERVASERIGRETVTYVSNIFKYYVAYKLMTDQRERREAAKAEVGKRK